MYFSDMFATGFRMYEYFFFSLITTILSSPSLHPPLYFLSSTRQMPLFPHSFPLRISSSLPFFLPTLPPFLLTTLLFLLISFLLLHLFNIFLPLPAPPCVFILSPSHLLRPSSEQLILPLPAGLWWVREQQAASY